MKLYRELTSDFSFRNHGILTLTLMATTGLISMDATMFSLIVFMVCVAWRAWIEFVSLKIPSRWITGAISLALIAMAYQEYRTLIGSDVTVTLMVGLTGLKILECSAERDKYFLYLLCWSMVGFKFLFQVDLWILLPSAVITMIIYYLLLRDQSSLPPKKVMLMHLASAIPIALVLFVIFPRNKFPIVSGLGSGITVADSAVSGFSDEIMPGSIANLTKVQQTAFRVQFDPDHLPDLASLYWRGDTLAEADGLHWKKKYNSLNRDRQTIVESSGEKEYGYTTLLEPHGKSWIFTLPGTVSVSSREASLSQNRNSSFYSMNSIYRNISYRGFVNPHLVSSPSEEKDFLGGPAVSDKIRQLIAPMAKMKNRKQKALALLNIFRNGSFQYTLNPGTMDSVDELLFEKKAGFCEHFSAAYATMARALGIPARIVVGYQGGEFNSVGNFWKVSQSDAHAWVEIVDDQDRWVRVDPTAAVAPARIQRGASSAQGFAARLLNIDRFSVISLFFDSISNFFEDLNFRWNILLIEFDSEYRQDLINYLKLFFEESLVPAGLVFIALYWLAKRIYRRRLQGAGLAFQKVFKRFEIWGRQKGFQRLLNEAPLQYCERLSRQFPSLKKEIEILARAYDLATYSENQDPEELRKMRRSFRRIKAF